MNIMEDEKILKINTGKVHRQKRPKNTGKPQTWARKMYEKKYKTY